MAIRVINRAQVPLRTQEGYLGSYQIGEVNRGSWRQLAGHPKVNEVDTWREKLRSESLEDLQAEAKRAGIELTNTHGKPCAFAEDREKLGHVIELYARADNREPLEAESTQLYSAAKAVESEADFAIPSRRPDVLSWYLDVWSGGDFNLSDEASDE